MPIAPDLRQACGRFGGAILDVDVSLTTIADRIGQVHLVIGSILNQNPPPARVFLYLSQAPWLLDSGVRDVPDTLHALVAASRGRLVVGFVENTGPYRKILPWLAEHGQSGRLVVTADDDTIYPQGWLAGLLAAWRPGLAVAHSAHPVVVRGGRLVPYGQWFKAALVSPALHVLPIGKDGVLYRAADFPPDVLDVATALRIAPSGDDLWLRWHLARAGVSVAVAGQGKLPEVKAKAEPRVGPGESLWRSYNRGGGNDAMIAALEAYFDARYGFTMAALAAGRDQA